MAIDRRAAVRWEEREKRRARPHRSPAAAPVKVAFACATTLRRGAAVGDETAAAAATEPSNGCAWLAGQAAWAWAVGCARDAARRMAAAVGRARGAVEEEG